MGSYDKAPIVSASYSYCVAILQKHKMATSFGIHADLGLIFSECGRCMEKLLGPLQFLLLSISSKTTMCT